MTKSFTLGKQLVKGALYVSEFHLQFTNCFDIQRSNEFIQCLNIAGMQIATVSCTHGTGQSSRPLE